MKNAQNSTDWDRVLYSDIPVFRAFGQDLSRSERLSKLPEFLIPWFIAASRDLPWRHEITPYRVWISEIMLQQTRVEAVKPYYARFLTALPTIADLAVVDDDLLMKLWEGLGYYSRARNLKKAAICCMEEYDGRMPDTYEKLLSLPGIGSYTAGAIGSIAYHLPVPAVDGNVLRVITRILGDPTDITLARFKKQIEEELTQVLVKMDASIDPGLFNSSLMELGAVICVPNGAPQCERCPVRGLCVAAKEGRIDELPVKTAKKPRRVEERDVYLFRCEGKILLVKRPEGGMLAGLYEFPNEIRGTGKLRALLKEDITCKQMQAKHVFTHVEWHMRGFLFDVDRAMMECIANEFQDVRIASEEKIRSEAAIPGAFQYFFNLLESE